eukprot:13045956-Heterocapsa_arctica.AAC.1
MARKLQEEETNQATERQLQEDAKLARDLEHREGTGGAGTSSDHTTQTSKRTPFEEIHSNDILDGQIKAIMYN